MAPLLARDIEIGGERNRGLYILKSRGMAHSNQIREFRVTDHGIELLDVYVGPGGVLTGSARITQEAKENEEHLLLKEETERKKLELERKRKALEAQIALLQVEFEAGEAETRKLIKNSEERTLRLSLEQREMALSRKADSGV